MSSIHDENISSTSSASANAHTSADSSADDGSTKSSNGEDMVDHAFFMLLNSDGSKVLMVEEDKQWNLPRFAGIHDDYDIDECCLALQKALDIPQEDDETVFTIAAELLGTFADYDPDEAAECGYVLLFMVEPHLDPIPIPNQYDWKDAPFVRLSNRIDKKSHRHTVLEHTLNYMTPHHEKALARITDPRHHFGWFASVSRWIRTILSSMGVSSIGRLKQVHVHEGSTVLKQNSSQGYFFVKAPVLGCNERSISIVLTVVMPRRVANVIVSSEKLRCFVTKAFEEADEFSESFLMMAVENLAQLHLESIQHLDYLRTGDCPDRSPQRIAETLQKWSTDEGYSSMFGDRIDKFRAIVPTLQELCATLSASEIPLTLVHGDYGQHNIAYRDSSRQAPILYDFEFACIAHPFMDMHCIDYQFFFEEEEHNKDEHGWCKRAREAYLAHFSKYCSDEATLRDEYRAAMVLGKTVQMMSIMERMFQCDFQLHSTNHDDLLCLCDSIHTALWSFIPFDW